MTCVGGKELVASYSEEFLGYPNVFLDLMAFIGGQIWNIAPSACNAKVTAAMESTCPCGTVVCGSLLLDFWRRTELDGIIMSEVELLSSTEGLADLRR